MQTNTDNFTPTARALASFPQELKDRPQWVMAGHDKKPLQANKDHANVKDPSTWGTFENVAAQAEILGYGIGFVLTADDEYCCVDLDFKDADSLDKDGNPYSPELWTQEPEKVIEGYHNAIASFDSYTERSKSGKGFHIWIKGNIGRGRRKEGVEVYSQERFIICTGDVYLNKSISARPEQLATLLESMGTQALDLDPVPDEPEKEKDNVIIDRAMKAANSEKFAALRRGEWKELGYPSQSEADSALMHMLTFYSPNGDQVKRIFRTTELGTRDKATEDDKYLDRTIATARRDQAAKKAEQENDTVRECINTIVDNWYAQRNSGFSRFDISDNFDEMEKKMLDDKYVLPRIAILGQITHIYAKSNVGKTLLTIYLLINAVERGDIKGEDVYYINADDDMKGLITKGKMLKKYKIKTLSPGYNGFKVKDFIQTLNDIVARDDARGKIIVLDTLKKFTDLMDKKLSSNFMSAAREFAAKGGTMISLAHANKNRDANGKINHAGTSDSLDDCDCAYLLDEVSKGDDERTVVFENIKCRGDVAMVCGFVYSMQGGQEYSSLINSVEPISDERAKTLLDMIGEARPARGPVNQNKEILLDTLRKLLPKVDMWLPVEQVKSAALEAGVTKRGWDLYNAQYLTKSTISGVIHCKLSGTG
jgi:archaellum biogenesis ATPase FlaH